MWRRLSLILRREIGVGTPRVCKPPETCFSVSMPSGWFWKAVNPITTPRNFPQSNGPFYRHWGIKKRGLKKAPSTTGC